MHKELFNSFIKKSGENSFNEIKNSINIELSNCISVSKCQLYDDYLIYIFETAFFKYCGVQVKKIPFVIKQMGNDYIPIIPFNELLEIHNNSINLIIKCFEDVNA